ncbi:MAG: hypothetical protein IT305_28310 [Chloroflexi bacterium]|nr:hypothetical protein [Chloroflexota bacterium]
MTDPAYATHPARGADTCGVPSIAVGTVVALIGGLALLAAFSMPWFSTQGLLLSGDFLARFLGNPNDVRRFAPGLAADPSELRLLRGLVYLFPASGALACLLAVVTALWRAAPGWLGMLLAASGLVPLVALLGGITRLPPGAHLEVGLWVIGAGALATLLGPQLNRLLRRQRDLSSL